MTSPSHGGGPESESQRAHPDSLIMTRNGFDSENASFIRVSMTLKALLALFLSNEMVFLVKSDESVGVFERTEVCFKNRRPIIFQGLPRSE
jgi:hypothetical protein